jgi:CheY-like chemotaxis protein
MPTDANRPATILLVDDELTDLDVGARMLRRQGYAVLTAASGPEAMRAMEGHVGTVDLLITDVRMPEMSGPDLALSLSPRYPNLRVLFCSGFVDDPRLRDYIGHTGVHFLGKPYSIAQLTEIVARLLATPIVASERSA